MADRTHDLRMTGAWSILRQRFMDVALAASAVEFADGWTDMDPAEIEVAVDTMLGKFPTLARSSGENTRAWMASEGKTSVWLLLSDSGSWEAGATGNDGTAARAWLDRLRSALPPRAFDEPGQIPVRFWAMGAMGPISFYRLLDVDPWADVQTNYPAAVNDQVAELMKLDQPDSGGKLLLFHGPAGTGKTRCVETLVDSWRAWCDVDYVVDADAFFEHASYMISALIDGADSASRWRLVVIEDAGEFMVPDEHKRASQGLSRLLNLTDGLVGQGLRLLVLMTTNEPFEKLYPALIRPGRCLAQLEFGAFPADEAAAWLAARDKPPTAAGPMTLAELYAS